MTASERLDLIDEIGFLQDALARAGFLLDDIIYRFFDQFTTGKADIRFIENELPHYAAYAHILQDTLTEAGAHIPAPFWLKSLSVDDEEESKPKTPKAK